MRLPMASRQMRRLVVVVVVVRRRQKAGVGPTRRRFDWGILLHHPERDPPFPTCASTNGDKKEGIMVNDSDKTERYIQDAKLIREGRRKKQQEKGNTTDERERALTTKDRDTRLCDRIRCDANCNCN